ncbi:Nin one binding Zn-ribbon like-domain-containing protein [Pseudomassariella vexata]|uniref:20S-pre-rRNA D-site endonuclease NOB1 n=1 Tax=Pseudomassariella vexata TaxID=1141098 RepID=A0A1Y2EIP7_9PEZI|nr:Nin one binding Zn-ribbon like-domain-containing protein [Pseudomassariella vexata]ORY71452.1 Nin one binding Zn-ribbon like-domain-containing protein [Pseudomassariella vexata]
MATAELHMIPTEMEVPEKSLETPNEASKKSPEIYSAPTKPIHTLILDTGPLIKNDPPVSSLIAQAHELYTLPSVISEIKDAATRARVQTQLLPFIKLRSPKPESRQFVTGFARRTGDLEVLSRPDLDLIALAYELEIERNGGDWRLRKEPGQKTVNGKSPAKAKEELERQEQQATPETGAETEHPVASNTAQVPEIPEIPQDVQSASKSAAEGERPVENKIVDSLEPLQEASPTTGEAISADVSNIEIEAPKPDEVAPEAQEQEQQPVIDQEAVSHQLESLSFEPSSTKVPQSEGASGFAGNPAEEDDDDEAGWITPSNVKTHLAKDQNGSPEEPIQKLLQVALLTSDYAMQNVLLRMNLNLVSPRLARITRVKTWILRCHGCFQITRDMSKTFCPKCGQPTLTRVSCSTDQSGNFQIHLKKNFQWNTRGNVYSVPKPTHGTANGKYRGQGGGRNGWGQELILAEDQKEYTRRAVEDRRIKQKDLMDEDYLPSILTGNRQGGHGKIRVGAGRNINSKKRHA